MSSSRDRERHRLVGGLLFGMLVLAALSFLPAAASAVDTAPHVTGPDKADTDVCAMCHRTHTAMGDVEFRTQADSSTLGNALIVSPTSDRGDAGFCYTCHGVDTIGSDHDVQTPFLGRSRHSMAPTTSAYGPSPKQCSDCHDSHGSARTTSGAPYPALLRSYGTAGVAVNSGEEYCATCHTGPRPNSKWDGLAVYRKTAHYSAIPTPTSGTDIRCSICHDPHGSDVAPILARYLTPPTVPATVAVTANDRTLCFDCHPDSYATYPGAAVYQTSAHALSSAAVSVTSEWASADTTRAVGECQVCHAPMGRSDGAGGVIPKLADKAGAQLCLECHTATGAASTDFAALSYPATAAASPVLVAAWGPPTGTPTYGRIAVYSQAPNGGAPHSLVGPREYTSGGSVGQIAVGDIDGDGRNELVVADPSSAQLSVFSQDPLRGITTAKGPGVLTIASPADLVAVGDFIADGSGRAEIAVVDRSAGSLYVYRYDGSGLSAIAGPLPVGAGASSIAVGDVTGTPAPDVVVTARDADSLTVFSESGGTLVSAGTFPTRSKPVGASVGDVWPGNPKEEIVVLNSGESTGQLSVFDGAGHDLSDYDVPGPSGAVVAASAIGDVLPAASPTATTSGLEVAVALSSSTGTSAVDVFAQQAGGGLTTPQSYDTGPRYASGSLATGDVDGDGHAELIVGNAGRWAIDDSRQLASVQVFHADADGGALDTGATSIFAAGGVELSGAPPALAVADLGGIGPSRHPWGAVPSAHVSTETAPFARHVECTDCHNAHEATSTVAAAPDAYGAIKGAWGASVSNVSTTSITYTERRGVVYEYELCFKCHSGWADPLQGRRNLAFEFNALNPSVHAVEVTATTSQANADSFVAGWGNSSVLYCKDCHADQSVSAPKGPHTSADAPILVRPYLGESPADSQGLCYKCHRNDVYYTGAADSGSSASLFATSDGTKLHSVHTATWGFGCESCHVSHGSSTMPHLIGSSVGYTHTATGGGCVNDCHPGAGASYTR